MDVLPLARWTNWNVGVPGETQCLRRRRALLHAGLVAARRHALLVGRHIGSDLAGNRARKAAGIGQAVPLLLRLEERRVHLPEPGRALLGHAGAAMAPRGAVGWSDTSGKS